MKRIFLFPIVFYRKHLSRLKGAPSCRFTPTCSLYAYKAIDEWGIFAGSALAVYRILRCNPFCKCGKDDIPRRKRKAIPKTLGYIKKPKRTEPFYFCYEI
jgi:putative membrane protein insertion efficiency factor